MKWFQKQSTKVKSAWGGRTQVQLSRTQTDFNEKQTATLVCRTWQNRTQDYSPEWHRTDLFSTALILSLAGMVWMGATRRVEVGRASMGEFSLARYSRKQDIHTHRQVKPLADCYGYISTDEITALILPAVWSLHTCLEYKRVLVSCQYHDGNHVGDRTPASGPAGTFNRITWTYGLWTSDISQGTWKHWGNRSGTYELTHEGWQEMHISHMPGHTMI